MLPSFLGADPWSLWIQAQREAEAVSENVVLRDRGLGSESPGCKNVAMVLTHQPIGPASLVGLLIPGPIASANRTLLA